MPQDKPPSRQPVARRVLQDEQTFLPSIDLNRLTSANVRNLVKDLGAAGVAELALAKAGDATHFYAGLERLKGHVDLAIDLLPDVRALPGQVKGQILRADGLAAQRVAVEPATPAGVVVGPGVVTNDDGVFTLPLRKVSDADTQAIVGGGLALNIKGANAFNERLLVGQLPSAGATSLGVLKLAGSPEPLPKSVVGALIDLVGGIEAGLPEPPQAGGSTPGVSISLGEDACQIAFRGDQAERRYPYSLLVRLVEPRTTVVTRSFFFDHPQGGKLAFGGLGLGNGLQDLLGKLTTKYVDRVPIGAPISVDGFRDQVTGRTGDVIGVGRTVPMAGTLGLGYVVNLAQTWTPAGHSLGNLVYSLPLAPGEQQRIAVVEKSATAVVRDSETFEMDEIERASSRQDSSTEAVFQSAFNESMRGGSSFESQASSSSWGVSGGGGLNLGIISFGGGASGGGSKNNASGSTHTALDGARNYTSHAAENLHNHTERESAARRRAQRTSVHLATETERESVTTKVITNHNKAHALTMQYWEVLRHFQVGSAVEGVNLVCFVPLDLVRFLDAGQQAELDLSGDLVTVDTRAEVIRRFASLVHHAEAIRRWLPPQYRRGLKLAEEMLANPRAGVDLAGPAVSVLHVILHAAVLPGEDVSVAVRTRRGTTIGPVRLDSGALDLPTVVDDPAHAFKSRADLLAELGRRRAHQVAMTGNVTLPIDVDSSEIVSFDIYRTTKRIDYQLNVKKEDIGIFEAIGAVVAGPLGIGIVDAIAGASKDIVSGVHLSPSELEGLFGGPRISLFRATINGTDLQADSIFNPTELSVSGYPVPATDRQRSLNFKDLMEMERTLQHVVRNTVTYSKAVWTSLTPEERVIMLEGYTIGMPPDGLTPDDIGDASQHVPLLNCVANQVLGWYGNSMILPFSIPPSLATRLGGPPVEGEDVAPLTTGRVQDALTRFHRQAFSPPISHVVLPTHGVLGEAVLGHCPSAEKIDLTRFWNWQDSPTESATEIAPIAVTGLNAGSLSAPSSLASLPSIINNVGASDGTAVGALAQALIGAGPKQTGFDTALAGLSQLSELGGKSIDSAEKARADALGRATSMAEEALKAATDIAKGARADQQAKDALDAKDAKARHDSAFGDLKDNAASYLGLADAKPDPASALTFAKGIVDGLSGEGGLGLPAAAKLFSVFNVASGAGRTQGSTAFLSALGLL
jgi:hypothetical protein